MARLPAAAQVPLHTISPWFIWTLNLARLHTAIGPLGRDNWSCISHQDGWNNIQDGWAGTLPTTLLLISISNVCWTPARGPIYQCKRVWLSSYISIKKCWQWVRAQRCHCEHPPKSWTRSSLLREHHAPLCLPWQSLPPFRKYHSVIQRTVCSVSFWCIKPQRELWLHPSPRQSSMPYKICTCLRETKLCFVIIRCLCVWIHRVSHKACLILRRVYQCDIV